MVFELAGIPGKDKRTVSYKGGTEGVPLFTSPTLNISGIEVDIEGLEVVRGQRWAKRAKYEFDSVSGPKNGLPGSGEGPRHL